MQKFFGGCIMALALATAASAAERLKARPDRADLDYSQHNNPGRLIAWEYPVYAAEPNADWTEERVRLAFVVDATGTVGEITVLSGPDRFRGPAVAAVKQWKFTPAIVDDRPVAAARELSLPFKPTGTPPKSIREDYFMTQVHEPDPVAPGDPFNPEPQYPRFLESRRLSGEVELLLGINPEGRVDGVQVIRATHPDFLSAALDTVAAWECRPAHVGMLPIAGKKQAALAFYTTDETGRDNHADWMEHNGIFLRMPENTKVVDYFDEPVEALRMVDPVYPYTLAEAGIRGGARVNFTIDPRGRVIDVSVAEATAPEFGESAAAAIAAWQFKPLQRHGETVGADFSFTWKFNAPREGSAEQRLLAAAADQPVSARQLDRPLFPLYRSPAVFPAGRLDAGEAGAAEIEMIIDRDGRVRLPRVRGASQPEFGWAAATAVSQWLFETPLQGGRPVDVRVMLPVEFKAPPVRDRTLAPPEKSTEVERVQLQN
jgi:TonB family protein